MGILPAYLKYGTKVKDPRMQRSKHPNINKRIRNPINPNLWKLSVDWITGSESRFQTFGSLVCRLFVFPSVSDFWICGHRLVCVVIKQIKTSQNKTTISSIQNTNRTEIKKSNHWRTWPIQSLGERGEGGGGGRFRWGHIRILYTAPEDLQSSDGQYKAPTDYTKHRQAIQRPQQDYTKPERLYKDL